MAASAATRLWDDNAKLQRLYQKKYDELRAAKEQEKAKVGKKLAKRSGGSIMRLFLLYEIATLLVVVSGTSFFLFRRGFHEKDWFFWLTIEAARFTHPLLGYPYLIFLLGTHNVSRALATGYSRAGWLCHQCTVPEVQQVRPRVHKKKYTASIALHPSQHVYCSASHHSASYAGEGVQREVTGQGRTRPQEIRPRSFQALDLKGPPLPIEDL